jgi:PPOX class probable F420-dependent enzyme
MSPVNAFHRITRKQDRLFDTLRDPRAVKAAAQPGTATDFDALKGAKYSLLVTSRRSGEPVATPVWFGLHDGRVYARTLVDAGKVKRLAAGSARAYSSLRRSRQPRRSARGGRWRVLRPEGNQLAESALNSHYGWGRRLYERIGSTLGVQTVNLEITPGGNQSD